MNTNTTNSQAASIDTPEFHELLWDYSYSVSDFGASYSKDERAALIAHIDAKLAQIEDAGWTAGRQQCYIDALERSAVAGLTHDRDGWKARATAAEAKLEAIRQGFAQLPRYGFSSASSGICEPEEFTELDDGRLVYHREVLALLQPQGQADTK